MGLFGKKKRVETENNIPELPKLPEMENDFLPRSEIPDVPPGLPDIETRPVSDSLPDFPPGKEKTNESDDNSPNEYEYQEPLYNEPPRKRPRRKIPEPEFEPIPQSREIEDLEESRTVELGPSETQGFSRPSTRKIEPIFIRLDKFQTTIETFEEIKSKVIEIESLLEKIRETKNKEEQELIDWEREIQIIKSRIDSVDKNIFSKLD